MDFQFMFVKNVVDCMKKYPSSINIDECTSKNSHKVFSILVSYFDTEVGASVVQHYTSVSLIEVNKNVFVTVLLKMAFRLITLFQI